MHGEPRKIREVAERLERRAEGLRAEADALHTASQEIAWVSVAADRMREHARDRRDELVQVAREYHEAARKVREHAAEVQRLLDLIATIERQVRAIVSAAIDRVKDAVGKVVDGIKDALSPGDEEDKKLAETPMPPPGHDPSVQDAIESMHEQGFLADDGEAVESQTYTYQTQQGEQTRPAEIRDPLAMLGNLVP